MKNIYIKPLHKKLLNNYCNWKENKYPLKKNLLKKLARGQKPRFMILACCDSRINISSLFNEEEGSFFIHRNIANIVPPYKKKITSSCVESVIQYAVSDLKVQNIIILGHSNCGGIKAFIKKNKEKKIKKDFISCWLENLNPLLKNKNLVGNKKLHTKDYEQNAIKLSLSNLLTYPFVKKSMTDRKLSFTGLWYEIKSGEMECYEPKTDTFKTINKN